MPITMNWYPSAFDGMFKGVIKQGDTFKVALLTSAGTFNAAHDEWADVSSAEASGTNYVQKTVVITSALDSVVTPTRTEFTIPQSRWGNLTCTFRNAVVFDDTSTGDKLLMHLDFGEDQVIIANDFQLNAPDPKPAIDPA